MRKRIVVGLFLLNVSLAAAITMGPLAAQLLPTSAPRDCCKEDVCCNGCCWFVQDCATDGDCELN